MLAHHNQDFSSINFQLKFNPKPNILPALMNVCITKGKKITTRIEKVAMERVEQKLNPCGKEPVDSTVVLYQRAIRDQIYC